MMTNPQEFFGAFAKAGADSCTFHVEIGDTKAHIEKLRSLGIGVGLALNPETPVESVLPFLGDIDLLLCMTVHPGFGGQSFISSVLEKVKTVHASAKELGVTIDIQVDGGIDATTIVVARRAGANVFVAGSFIFGSPDPQGSVQRLRTNAQEAAK
jgi:ribulose-phosphate 3-epimerase